MIGAATSAGAYGPGQERAPQFLRRHGLVRLLSASGRVVRDLGDVVTSRHQDDPDHPTAGNVGLVRDAAERVGESVDRALRRGDDVLVLGGDCTVELGTTLGARADGSSVGLVYVDLDGDLNTPTTGDGVLDWMGLAHLLDVPGAVPELASLGGRRPLLAPEAVFMVGQDNLTAPERDVVDRLGLRVAPLAAVQSDPESVHEELEQWATAFDRVLVHVDIDVLHYPSFSIAHEVRDAPGLSIDQLDDLTSRLRGLPGWTGLTLCEVNPDHATAEREQFERLVQLLGRAV